MHSATLMLRRLAPAAPASLPPLCPTCQDTGRVPDPEGGPCVVLCPECRPSCRLCGHELTAGTCYQCGWCPEEQP